MSRGSKSEFKLADFNNWAMENLYIISHWPAFERSIMAPIILATSAANNVNDAEELSMQAWETYKKLLDDRLLCEGEF